MHLRLPSMIEVQFPFVLIKTRIGLSLMDRLGRTRLSGKMGLVFSFIMPLLGAVMIYFLINAVNNMLLHPGMSKVLKELGPAANILLPGVNPYLPIFYGWISLLMAMIIHECAHGVQARTYGMNVKSTGLVLFLIIPVGAFAEVDERELEEVELRKASGVLSAGPVSNFLAAFVALTIFILLIFSLRPVTDGILIAGLAPNGSAYKMGIRAGDIIVGINDEQTPDWDSFVRAVKKAYERGENIGFAISGNGLSNHFSFDPSLNGTGILDVIPLKDVLENYSLIFIRSPIEGIIIYLMIPTIPFPWVYEAIPFSPLLQEYYTSTIFGKYYHYPVNFFYWLWFINFNLGIFNALPLYPMDGGIVFKLICRKKLGNRMSIKAVDRMVYTVSFILLCLIMSIIIIPYVIG